MLKRMKDITNEEAIQFLKNNHARKEQVAYDNADRWIECYVKQLWYNLTFKKLVGVVGISNTKNVARIKGLYVLKDYRHKHIGINLVRLLLQQPEFWQKKRSTLFATKSSKGLFEQVGYRVKSTNKYDISFMERPINDSIFKGY